MNETTAVGAILVVFLAFFLMKPPPWGRSSSSFSPSSS